jgi:ABC-type sugar transport system substrate-binding protein
VDHQLRDFKEQWAEWDGRGPSTLRSLVLEVANNGEITPNSASLLSANLSAPDLAFIIAFDVPGMESALSLLPARVPATSVPIIAAFDPNDSTLDAVDEGRIYAAVSQDPYLAGYEGVARAAKLCQCKVAEMIPLAGYGMASIPSELVEKANLADYRRRIQARSISANYRGVPGNGIEMHAEAHLFESAERS